MPALLGNVLKAAEHVLNREPICGAVSPMARILGLGINWNVNDSFSLLLINH